MISESIYGGGRDLSTEFTPVCTVPGKGERSSVKPDFALALAGAGAYLEQKTAIMGSPL
jgi:hypothetical protein